MIHILVTLVCLLFTSLAFSFELTQEHIHLAEIARAEGEKIGLDKMTSQQLKEITKSLVKDKEAAKSELTEKEKKAYSCLGRKLMDMQFRSDIKEFARYLNDNEYQDKINKQYEKECKVNELNN